MDQSSVRPDSSKYLPLLLLLFAGSGCSALIYETVWYQSLELAIGYEGTIVQDGTRLIQMGIPEDIAKHSSWDQISATFTAVRGAGYVSAVTSRQGRLTAEADALELPRIPVERHDSLSDFISKVYGGHDRPIPFSDTYRRWLRVRRPRGS